MAMLALKILDRDGSTKAVSRGESAVSLVHTAEYEEGDRIVLYTRADFPHSLAIGKKRVSWVKLNRLLR